MLIEVSVRDQNFVNDRVQIEERSQSWDTKETAVIVVDMWEKHRCTSAQRRIQEMAPFLNEFIKTTRELGTSIVHAPSECMDFYHNAKGRSRAIRAKNHPTSIPIRRRLRDQDKEPRLPVKPGCSCDTIEPCPDKKRKWLRQIDLIDIEDSDYISDVGQEVYNLFKDKGIKNVIYTGVHANICILRRPFGIRQMKLLGINAVLCRDMTDSYHRAPHRHFEGSNAMIDHIERYVCNTVCSSHFSGGKPFRFSGDNTFRS